MMFTMCTNAPLKTLARGLEALVCLSKEPQGYSSGELAKLLKIDRTASHRILRTLQCCGFAYQEDGKYRLSYRLFVLLMEAQSRLAQLARPVLRELAGETGYTASLALWEGGQVVPVVIERGQAPLVVNSNLGTPVPLHASALGKVMLAFQEEKLRDQILRGLKLERLTENTITSRKRLARELEAVRERGYATDHEEYRVGIRCVAFPILGEKGQAMAAISVSYPATSETMSPVFEGWLIEKISIAVNNISQHIGRG